MRCVRSGESKVMRVAAMAGFKRSRSAWLAVRCCIDKSAAAACAASRSLAGLPLGAVRVLTGPSVHRTL